MWCIIIPFLTAIIGAILGWLLRHLTCKCNEEDEVRLKQLEIENINLKSELEACVASKNSLQLDLADMEANLKTNSFAAVAAETEPVLIFDADVAKQYLGKKIKADDLTVVEGIGPKIAELYKDNGIATWYQLSQASVERCKEILDAGGPRFTVHIPNTWPHQAKLAFEGKWEELNRWQDELDGGR